jgi:carboxypeptidase family protein
MAANKPPQVFRGSVSFDRTFRRVPCRGALACLRAGLLRNSQRRIERQHWCPGATVVLTDQQKGFEFRTPSDSSGRYLFRSIPPGAYTVSADVKGFQKVTSAVFKVDINENRTTNLTLKVAGISQKVEVGAQAQTIQTEDAETGQVVNRRYINDLPLIDRNVVELTSLAPGVTEMDDQCDVTAQARILCPTAAEDRLPTF